MNSRGHGTVIAVSDHEKLLKDVEDSPLLHDLLHVVDYIERMDGVNITKVRGTIGRKHVRGIIDGFREKPKIWPPSAQPDEWRYPRLMMIDAILRCLRLVEEEKSVLRVTGKVKEFRGLSPDEQIVNMFTAWWSTANWEVVVPYRTIQPREEGGYFELIKYLRELMRKKGRFRAGDVIGKWQRLSDSTAGKKVVPETGKGQKGLRNISKNSIKGLVTDPLTWFGILRKGPESEFYITPLGSMLIELVFSMTKQARLEADLAKYGRSLESFYRYSMYGSVVPMLPMEEDDEPDEGDEFIPRDYAS